MDTNGNEIDQLTSHGTDDHSPAWSPDGKKLVFVSSKTGADDIHIMNADGSEIEVLILEEDPMIISTDPHWSSLGR